MSRFLSLTTNDLRAVRVNVDMIVSFRPFNEGTQIVLVGQRDNLNVTEGFEELVHKIEAGYD